MAATWKDDEVRGKKIAAFVVPETGQRIGDLSTGAITEDHMAAFLVALSARAGLLLRLSAGLPAVAHRGEWQAGGERRLVRPA
jgi:hypothetical protein